MSKTLRKACEAKQGGGRENNSVIMELLENTNKPSSGAERVLLISVYLTPSAKLLTRLTN